MKKKAFLLAVLTLFLLFLFTTAFSAEKGKKVTIRFMAALYSEATAPFWNDMIAAFEKEYPNVKVEIDIVNWDNVYQKTTTLISAKQEPDVLNTDTILVQYAADGLLEPLDGYMDAKFKGQFTPALLTSGVYNGKTFALPLLASVRGLFYNKDVLADAGVQPPKTMDEFVKVCQAINDPPDFYAFGMPIETFEGQAYISYFLWAAGGDWLDKNGRCAVNSPEGVQALQFASDLVNKYKVVYPGWSTVNRDDQQKVMIAGKMGMIMTANFFETIAKSENPDLKLGVVPIPKWKEQHTVSVVDSLMVFKRSKYKQEAFDFIKFYFRKEWHMRMAKAEGVLACTKDAAAEMEKDPEIAKYSRMLPAAKLYPLNPSWEPMVLEVVKAWQIAIMGEKEPKTALDEVVAKINKEILKK
jgi:multiple sugar transport system substrate-binding protein